MSHSPIKSFGVGIAGLGKSFPKKKITNEELARSLQIPAASIQEKNGILTRYYAGDGESAFSLSLASSREAIRRAKADPKRIDSVIGCTTSGDYVFPALACRLQHEIGAVHAGAFDLSASASSFPAALRIAYDRFRGEPSVEHILIVGTAVQSPLIDWSNVPLAVLLGDASGAALLSKVPEGYGILATELLSRGENFEAACLKNGGFIEMDGVAMGREFLKEQPLLIEKALGKAGLKVKDVDLFIFHQANLRLIQYAMDRLAVPMSKTFANVQDYGNVAEASIPAALCEAWEKGLVKKDGVIVLSGVGAGVTLSAAVLKWQ